MLTYERLEEILEFFDAKPYSGRGMYGKDCLSVTTVGGQSALKMLADVVTECTDIDEVAELLRCVRTDSMGLDTVLYWPSVTVPA